MGKRGEGCIHLSVISVIFMISVSLAADLFAQGNEENIRQKVEEIFTSYRTIDNPEVPELLAELGSPAVPILLEMLEEDPNDIGLIEALGMIGDERAVPLLSEMLLDPECTNQMSLTMALMRIGNSLAESAVLNFFEQAQSQGNDWQLLAGQALLKIGGETSKQKVKEMVSYVRDLYERRKWIFDEEVQREIFEELRSSSFYNGEMVYAFLASLIIDSKDTELITKAIKYRQLVDESGSRFTDGFRVLVETGIPEAIETIFKFAENNEEMWPPAPPDATEEQRIRFFSVHPVIRVSAVETLLTVNGVDIERVKAAFDSIPVEELLQIPVSVKFQPDKWNLQWRKEHEGKGMINCYIGNIPGNYSPSDIVPSSIKLFDRPIEDKEKILKYHPGFIGEVLAVKFNKFEVMRALWKEGIWPGKKCDITITGELNDGKPFRGTSRIKVSKP